MSADVSYQDEFDTAGQTGNFWYVQAHMRTATTINGPPKGITLTCLRSTVMVSGEPSLSMVGGPLSLKFLCLTVIQTQRIPWGAYMM